MNLEDRRAAYDLQSQATIAEHGWMIQGVFPTEHYPGVEFAYTVGLAAAGLPELVISGLPLNLVGTLLNDAAQHTLTTELHPGDVLDGIASVPFRVIDAPAAEVNLSRRFYGADKVRALQLLWPDDQGNYPGDEGWTLGDAQDVFA